MAASSPAVTDPEADACGKRCKQPLTEAELQAVLALLIETLRAVSRTSAIFVSRETAAEVRDLFLEVQHVAVVGASHLLSVLKERGGEEPPLLEIPFFEQAIALPPDADRIGFLNRGQCWLIERLRDAASHVEDPALIALFSNKACAIEQLMHRFADIADQAH